MPIYEYVCDKCGEEFEELVRSERQKISCPSCKGKRVTKQFSLFGMKSSGNFSPSQGGCECSSCSSHSCDSCSCH